MGLNNTLKKLYKHDFCYFVGNATTALYLTLKGLGLKNKNICIPNSVCPNIPLAIILSENKPYFVDINKNNLGIDSIKLQNLQNIDAVIAVHAYGMSCEINEIRDYCKWKCIPLIEDFAVAQGGSFNQLPMGSLSDISILSFGAGKVINAGHGGAILIRDKALYEEISNLGRKLKNQNSSSKKKVAEYFAFHTSLYNNSFLNKEYDFYKIFLEKSYAMKNHILCTFDYSYENKIEEMVDNLEFFVNLRKKNYLKLRKLLVLNHKLKIIDCLPDCVPWRFNILVDNRDMILKQFLTKGIKVSSWYPSVDMFFYSRSTTKINTPISDYIGEKILNFWINEEIDDQYFELIRSKLNSYLTF